MVVDQDRLEHEVGFPEFTCSRQGLSFGGIESGDACQMDDEGSDIEALVQRRPAAVDPAQVAIVI